jgi:SOS response regulatory protein OraA/RecX
VLSPLLSSTVSKINQLGLLDEHSYIEYILRKYPKKSQIELVFLLRQRGIEYRPQLSRQTEIQKLKDIISKKYHSYNLADYNVKNKIYSRLANKGFPIELIKTAIDEILSIR